MIYRSIRKMDRRLPWFSELLQTVVAVESKWRPRSQYKEQNSPELVSTSNTAISSSWSELKKSSVQLEYWVDENPWWGSAVKQIIAQAWTRCIGTIVTAWVRDSQYLLKHVTCIVFLISYSQAQNLKTGLSRVHVNRLRELSLVNWTD